LFKRFFKRGFFGAVLAETALILPIVLGVTFAVIEFGRIFYYVNSLNHICRASARYASIGPNYTTTRLKTLSNATTLIPSAITITLTVSPTTGTVRLVGDLITVTASIPFDPVFPDFIKLFTGGTSTMWPTTLTVRATNRVEVASGGPT